MLTSRQGIFSRQPGPPALTTRRLARRGLLWLLLLYHAATPLAAHDVAANTPSPLMNQVGFEPPLNGAVPAELPFVDETGRLVRLGDYFGKKPVLLALVYYTCPMLCNQAIEGVAAALRVLTFHVGQEFEVLAVSFNPQETPAMAMAKKEDAVARYHHPHTEGGWHFLTGKPSSIAALTSAVHFRYVYDEQTKTFVHASGVIILTPQGNISRYFYGVEYAPRDLRLALVEASEGKIGTAADHVLLFCYQYNPVTARYGTAILRLLRLAGVLTVLLFLGSIAMFVRQERRNRRRMAAGGDTPW